MTWLNILAVFFGSGLGGVCRYLTSRAVKFHCAPSALFPWGTFAVNIVGCFLIGLLYGLFDRHVASGFFTPQLRLLLTVGFCGGFTTFSTFINENYLLLQSARAPLLFAYIVASIIFGALLLYAGYALSRL